LLFGARRTAASDVISSLRALADRCDGGNSKPGMRPPKTGAIVLLIALFFLFPVLFPVLFPILLFACLALAPFPSLLQWLFLYSAHIGAL
jgi:hypothetical protein